MALQPLKKIGLPDSTESVASQWLGELAERLQHEDERNDLTRELLLSLWYPDVTDFGERVSDPSVPRAQQLALLALDPRNITLEPEYYADVDKAKFQRVKPLLWLWYSFDRTPMAAQNVELPVRFRRLLAQRMPDEDIEGLFTLARTDGVMPIVRRTASFNRHRKLIVALLKHAPARQMFFRSVMG